MRRTLTGSKMADSMMTLAVVVADLAGGAAHDASDGQRAAGVGDEQRLGGQLALGRGRASRGARPPSEAYRDVAVPDRVGIEGMDGLAQLHEHVVGGVDDVRDGSYARRDESRLHIPGRRTDRHALDVAADEHRAQLGVRDRRPGGGRRCGRLISSTERSGQRSLAPVAAATSRARPRMLRASPRLGLTSTSSTMSPAMSDQVDAELGIRRQDEDAVGIAGQAQLITGAEHALALGAGDGGDVDAALARAAPSRAGPPGPAGPASMLVAPQTMESSAPPSPVRTRVIESLLELGCGATSSSSPTTMRCQSAPMRVDGADLHAQERQPFGQLLGRELDIDELAQPRERDAHATVAPGSACHRPGRRGCR